MSAGPKDQSQPPHGLIGLESETFWQVGLRPWFLGSGLVLGLALGIILWYWRRHAREKARVEPPVNPWDRIGAAIEELPLPQPSEIERYYLDLSAILREVLELKYGIHASGQTLSELQKSLSLVAALSQEQRDSYLSFLSLADRVKFAAMPVEESTHAAWKKTLAEWIREARPNL